MDGSQTLLVPIVVDVPLVVVLEVPLDFYVAVHFPNEMVDVVCLEVVSVVVNFAIVVDALDFGLDQRVAISFVTLDVRDLRISVSVAVVNET